MEPMVERYRKPTRILHWVHAGAFTVLFLTGLILFIPGLAILAQDSWSRVIHRVAAVIFIVAPLIYIPMNWKATWRGVRDAFAWGPEDLGWLQAAPGYYFLADEKAMPPQGHMNTGQKMWWFMVIVFGIVFVITGIIMWTFKTTLPREAFLWAVFVHDVSFIASSSMFFVHIYLSVAHPLMRPLSTGAWSSMAKGKVSVEYVKSHHARWYEEVAKVEEIAHVGSRK